MKKEYLSITICPHCASASIKYAGIQKDGLYHWICKDCKSDYGLDKPRRPLYQRKYYSLRYKIRKLIDRRIMVSLISIFSLGLFILALGWFSLVVIQYYFFSKQPENITILIIMVDLVIVILVKMGKND